MRLPLPLVIAPPNTSKKQNETLAPVLERNIRTLLARRMQEERARRLEDKIADAVTRFTGSMPFVYLHVFIFGAWIVWNLPHVPLPKFDPSLVILAMAASVESIFLSTFILISQNRSTALADKRADLDVQVSLLAEHEITRLVSLVSAVAEKMGIDQSQDPELNDIKKDVAPEQVLDKLESEYRKSAE